MNIIKNLIFNYIKKIILNNKYMSFFDFGTTKNKEHNNENNTQKNYLNNKNTNSYNNSTINISNNRNNGTNNSISNISNNRNNGINNSISNISNNRNINITNINTGINTNNVLSNEKHHYFIGHMFNDIENVRVLKNIQKKLKKKFKLRNNHSYGRLFANFLYLGYFEEKYADMYMTKRFNYLLQNIADKFKELECNYTEFKIEYDKTYYNIQLRLKDENDYLKNIIVPYMNEFGIEPVYGTKKTYVPNVNLVYYKESSILKDKKSQVKTEIPQIKFKIEDLCLLRATPVKSRSGYPSLHDQLNIEEVKKYKVPFNGNK